MPTNPQAPITAGALTEILDRIAFKLRDAFAGRDESVKRRFDVRDERLTALRDTVTGQAREIEHLKSRILALEKKSA